MLNLLKKYKDYTILIEDAETLQFIKINNITDDILKLYKFYEIDHANKKIYLESIKANHAILIAANDELELPLTTVKNINEAAKVLNVEATHIYRAYRQKGRPDVLAYNDYLLIKI